MRKVLRPSVLFVLILLVFAALSWQGMGGAGLEEGKWEYGPGGQKTGCDCTSQLSECTCRTTEIQ